MTLLSRFHSNDTSKAGSTHTVRSDPGASSRFIDAINLSLRRPSVYIAKGDAHQLVTLDILLKEENDGEMERQTFQDLHHEYQSYLDRRTRLTDPSNFPSRQVYAQECREYEYNTRHLRGSVETSSMLANSAGLANRVEMRAQAAQLAEVQRQDPGGQREAQHTGEQNLGASERETHIIVIRHDGPSSESCRLCRTFAGFVPLSAIQPGANQGSGEGGSGMLEEHIKYNDKLIIICVSATDNGSSADEALPDANNTHPITHYVVVRHEGPSSEHCELCRKFAGFVPLQSCPEENEEKCRTGTDISSPLNEPPPLPDADDGKKGPQI
ncbi:hypothetical protein B0H21DRAFT_758142 [Amylocystis lapponica]|nr:hypothetical protein B0H21DRAFT_758142 [Amylocystis lapponica]